MENKGITITVKPNNDYSKDVKKIIKKSNRLIKCYNIIHGNKKWWQFWK